MMVDGTGGDERRAGTTPPRRPGLIRSIAHRLTGDHLALPVEVRLASFAGATRWLHSEPLTPEGLRRRVVLVDFWTYTCVNWLRTLPYVRAWEAKYADAGLTVVGVHTPRRSSCSSATSTTWSPSRHLEEAIEARRRLADRWLAAC